MRTFKKNSAAAKAVPTRAGATRKSARSTAVAGGTSTSGLSGFSIDASDKAGRAAFPKLTRERASVRGVGLAAAPPVAVKLLDPESAALAHLDQALASNAVKAFTRPAAKTTPSEFKSVGTEAVALAGTTVVKFVQRFNKIPVYGSLVSVELGKDNECLGINSSLGTPSGVDHVATVSPAQALAVASKASGNEGGALTETPRLYYYFDQDKERWRLAYIIEDVHVGPHGRRKGGRAAGHDATVKDYVIDAHAGTLLAGLPRIATMAAVQEVVTDALKKRRTIGVETVAGGVRQLHDTALNVTTYGFEFRDPTQQSRQLPGTLYVQPPSPWPLEAIGAHANGSAVATFLRDILKRNNIDNRGGRMISTVNCWDKGEGVNPPQQWQNAYWNSKQMVYGQIKFPDGSFFSVASMLDVVGHEMFHGVTDYTSRLEYQTQAGALNESYSDIFGVVIANFTKAIDRWNWDIGTGFDGPGTALRNLEDPTTHGQPKHMRNFTRATPPYTYERNDYGHVHDNSGIHNYAAYRIITAKVGGRFVFTRKDLAALFYIALTVHLSRTSQFADSRRGMLQAARSLFRGNSAAVLARKVKAVEDGFAAAGIA
jgi:Zn-dependent metalloprotease